MRRTKEEADQTKKLILSAALDAFSENSYDLTTLSDIAKKAGVTRGAIYWHFKDKTDILKDLTNNHLGEFLNKLDFLSLSTDDKPINKIIFVFKFYFDYFLNNEANLKYKRILDEKMSFNENNSFVQEIFLEVTQKMVFKLNEIIIIGQEKGEIRKDVESTFFTFMLISLLSNLDRTSIIGTCLSSSFDQEFILDSVAKIMN